MHFKREDSVYEQIGDQKILELLQDFYPKVYDDLDLSPLFEGDMVQRNHQNAVILFCGEGGRISVKVFSFVNRIFIILTRFFSTRTQCFSKRRLNYSFFISFQRKKRHL
ncbi:globin family protein [Salinibacillus xinjiangensis]|uniref:Uncharacterized protein n=1 Tax=Salinibacillus xinjiangensis TaxID=1229268 RepID=A0A6G1X852_9BACI|nr:hypothetical protein [Salinibacillus xinjiangensis]MRG87144.1 hypothetical protein [Salinibacillus xinjiangensis]